MLSPSLPSTAGGLSGQAVLQMFGAGMADKSVQFTEIGMVVRPKYNHLVSVFVNNLFADQGIIAVKELYEFLDDVEEAEFKDKVKELLQTQQGVTQPLLGTKAVLCALNYAKTNADLKPEDKEKFEQLSLGSTAEPEAAALSAALSGAPSQMSQLRPQGGGQQGQPDLSALGSAPGGENAHLPPWAGGVAGQGPANATKVPDEQDALVQAAFKLCGVEAPAGFKENLNAASKDKVKKSYAEMAAGAQYGEPSPAFYPSKDMLEKLAAAARQGYWVPSELVAETSTSCERVLSTFLDKLLPIQHGESGNLDKRQPVC